jgi:MFS family permease
LINQFGAVTGWRVLAVALFVVMVPLGWIFVKDKPEDIGEKPDGLSNVNDIDKHKEENPKKILFHDDPWTLKEAMKTKAYWFLLFCMSVPSMINTGVTFHMVSIMNTKGYDSAFAALLLSIAAMVQFPFTFLAGFIVDRFKVHLIKTIGYSAYFGILVLLLIGQNQFSLIIYAVLLGIFMAFESVSTNVLWPNYFGRKHQGSIRGTAMTASVIGSALGPLPFGFAYDTLGGYSDILLIMLIFPVIAAFGAFLSPPPLYQETV